MALKIRLRKLGRTNRSCFRLVVTDCRSPRDGKYIEAVGSYDPNAHQSDKELTLKEDRIRHWLSFGAQMTENAASIIRRTSPEIVKSVTTKQVALRAKEAAKRKARKAKAATTA